jgi:transcriptional regulator with XRE-family HTH domain
MDIYDRIDALLKEKGISRNKLAELTRIPSSTISTAFMRRTKKFSVFNTQKIADVLGVTWHELIGLKDLGDGWYGDETDSMKIITMPSETLEFFRQSTKRRVALLDQYEKLNVRGQMQVLEYVSLLAETPRYQDNNDDD